MAEQNKQASVGGRITPEERFHYIGFEVYPGKGGDIFKSETEKAKLIEEVRQKRSKGDLIREQCSLLAARVSGAERVVLTVTCLIILLSLLAPWYSIYNTVVEQTAQPTATQAAQSAGEEIITAAQVRQKSHNEYSTLTGIGSLIGIGSVGGKMFSSGLVLILMALIMLVYTLATIAIPVYILMALYKKTKESADEAALRLKKLLRVAWYPVLLFLLAFIFSFFGADYASGLAASYSSLGSSFGPGAFLGSMSWGLLLTLGGYLVLAFKGVEI